MQNYLKLRKPRTQNRRIATITMLTYLNTSSELIACFLGLGLDYAARVLVDDACIQNKR